MSTHVSISAHSAEFNVQKFGTAKKYGNNSVIPYTHTLTLTLTLIPNSNPNPNP